GGCGEIIGRARAMGVYGADTSISLNFSAGLFYERGSLSNGAPENPSDSC
ncbi:hypothetical protein MNBD_ACTINO02-787, partial [hydrothermal vent metagenome]